MSSQGSQSQNASEDLVDIGKKCISGSFAASKRMLEEIPFLARYKIPQNKFTFYLMNLWSSDVSLIIDLFFSPHCSKIESERVGVPEVPVAKVQDSPQEFDSTPREAKFAFRSTDLSSWKTLNASVSKFLTADENNQTDSSDPIPVQHWAVVIYFPEGDLTYVFEANQDENTGYLEAYRARHVDYKVFEKAEYFGTAVTCPRELWEKAKQVKSNGTKYNPIDNNCQTWLKQFVKLISPELFKSLLETIKKLELPALVGCSGALLGGLLFLSKVSSSFHK
jgi:hypothetical protein